MMQWNALINGERSGERKSAQRPLRSSFEVDYDRIIFSYPFRRMQDKTQVFPLPVEDFVHSRLTHSLEVSSVGRSLGKRVGENVLKINPKLKEEGITVNDFGSIISVASLAHDLGNPPFGHSGEDAISSALEKNIPQELKEQLTGKEYKDIITFEGNAQGFRILNSLYPGLKLTYTSLAAFIKYPRESIISNPNKKRKSHSKYGFFQTEKDVVKDVFQKLEIPSLSNTDIVYLRHPLNFLVEAADDICYNIIDLEDGCRLGLINYHDTKALFKNILKDKLKEDRLSKIASINERISLMRSMAIGQLIEEVVEVYLDNEQNIMNGTFDYPLIALVNSKNTLEHINKVSIEKIYRAQQVIEREIAGFATIEGLVDELIHLINKEQHQYRKKRNKVLFRFLPMEYKNNLEHSNSVYEALRVIIDFISGLTDSHAVALYKNLKGYQLGK
ncbi:MAG TPA: deoxyguanosinetriphosphate triphosphohydrolase [Cyclobacteriaceae bacterium]